MQADYPYKYGYILGKFKLKYFWVVPLLISLLFLSWVSIGQAAPPTQKPKPPKVTEPNKIPTDEWAVQVVPDTNPDLLATRYGFENLGQVATLAHTYLFRRLPGDPKEREANPDRLRAAPEVKWMERQIARQRHKRVIPTDPLYADQWHLNNTGQSGGTPDQDVNVVPVWNNNIMGTGVVIGIVDDGLQHAHPDLSPNYVSGASWDFNNNDADPSPTSWDWHGTSVGGVAAARDNSTCGVGAAFRAGVAGLRLVAAPSTDADEASALTYQYNTNDIFSNSWGPIDDGAGLVGPGPLTLAALQDAVVNGRGGLGSIYVWAAGNGLQNNDNVNYDGFANSRFTIAIGAVDHDGVQSWYSEPGAAMLVTAPSSGDGVGVTTTDLLGYNGYDPGDCTNTFGGTSSATPLVSGLIALMLEANPNLTWRDVQHILVETTGQNDPGDSDWTTNSVGHLINHKYGFGRVDAEAAVNTATSWTNVGPVTSVSSGAINVNQPIPDNDPTGVTSTFFVNDNITLEHVEVIFDATHTYRGDLEIVLTSPSGTQSVLAEQHFADYHNDYSNWGFMTVRNWGESSQGAWTLKVSDGARLDTGTFNSWTLILHGTGSGSVIGPLVYNGHLIDDDNFDQSSGNNDGLVDAGETIELYVDLHNTGSGTATAVSACLSEDSPYVNGFLYNDCSPYGDIPGGGTATNSDDFEFTIDPATPSGHQINFTLTATDTGGTSWVSSFPLEVVGDDPVLYLEPVNQEVPLSGGNFSVNIMVDNAVDLGAFEFNLVYNPTIVHVSNVDLGPFLASTGRPVHELGPNIDNTTGSTTYGAFSMGSTSSGPNGSGLLATVVLSPQSEGDSDLLLKEIKLVNTTGHVTWDPPDANGHVTVNATFFADVDGDGDVDIVDIQLVASHFGCSLSDACYDSLYDLDNDLDIDLADVQIVACYWGWPNGDFSSCYIPTSTILTSIGTSQGAVVSIQPSTITVNNPNDVFTTTVEVTHADNLGAFGFELHYDPAIFEVTNEDDVTLGPFLGSTGRPAFVVQRKVDNNTGKVSYQVASLGPGEGPSGNGTLATVVMTGRAIGTSNLELQSVTLLHPDGTELDDSIPKLYLPFILKSAP